LAAEQLFHVRGAFGLSVTEVIDVFLSHRPSPSLSRGPMRCGLPPDQAAADSGSRDIVWPTCLTRARRPQIEPMRASENPTAPRYRYSIGRRRRAEPRCPWPN